MCLYATDGAFETEEDGWVYGWKRYTLIYWHSECTLRSPCQYHAPTSKLLVAKDVAEDLGYRKFVTYAPIGADLNRFYNANNILSIYGGIHFYVNDPGLSLLRVAKIRVRTKPQYILGVGHRDIACTRAWIIDPRVTRKKINGRYYLTIKEEQSECE